MAEKEQVKPLAPAAHRARPISFDDDDLAISRELKKHNNRKYIKCCGCISALILVLAVTILILTFTVFRVKDPVMNLNSGAINGLDRVSNATLSSMNITVTANISVKNPNLAAFKYNNATTTLYYDGVVVGEGRNPAGVARAGKTRGMNVTVDVMVEKILAVPRFTSDLNSGSMNISSYTMIGGRVKILNIFKKHVVVKMNCSMTVNITSQAIQDHICKNHVSF